MKQPRIRDFDPSAKERTGHGLKSPLTDFPTIGFPNQQPQEASLPDPVLPVRPVRDVPSVASVTSTTVSIGGRRKIKALSTEDRMRGGTGSMSAMVRHALDDYITKVQRSDA
jgi:hypothetical protein